MYGPRTQVYGKTNYLQEKIQVLDRTKALYGPRTQASGETNYLEAKTQVLDRIKALYGPRTQAYNRKPDPRVTEEALVSTVLLNNPDLEDIDDLGYPTYHMGTDSNKDRKSVV